MSGKRISQLNQRSTGAEFGVLAKYNPVSDKTEQTDTQRDLGATQPANIDWQADETYAIDDIRLYLFKAWKSLQNSNVGNVPSENAFWTEVSRSIADGITDTPWAPGVFTYINSKVIHNNIQYYLQVTPPYESTDIDTEILAGDWDTGTEVIDLVVDVTTSTYTVTSADLILSISVTATSPCTITIPTSLITAGIKKLTIKDAGGNSTSNNITIVGEGGETIDNKPNFVLNGNYQAINLYSINDKLYIY